MQIKGSPQLITDLSYNLKVQKFPKVRKLSFGKIATCLVLNIFYNIYSLFHALIAKRTRITLTVKRPLDNKEQIDVNVTEEMQTDRPDLVSKLIIILGIHACKSLMQLLLSVGTCCTCVLHNFNT